MARQPDLPINPAVDQLIEEVAEKVVIDLLAEDDVKLFDDLPGLMVAHFRRGANLAVNATWSQSLTSDDVKLANAIRRRLRDLKAAGGLPKLTWGRGRGQGYVKHQDHADKFNDLLTTAAAKQCACFCLMRTNSTTSQPVSFKELGNEKLLYPHLGLWLRNDDTCAVTWDNRKLEGRLCNGDASGLSFECDSHTLLEFKDTAEEWEKELASCTAYFRYANEVYICFPLCRQKMQEKQKAFGPWRQWEVVREMIDLAKRVGVGLLIMEYDLMSEDEWTRWSSKLTGEAVNADSIRLSTDPLDSTATESDSNKRWFEAFEFHELMAAKPNAVTTHEIQEYMEQRGWFAQLLAEERLDAVVAEDIRSRLDDLRGFLDASFKTIASQLQQAKSD